MEMLQYLKESCKSKVPEARAFSLDHFFKRNKIGLIYRIKDFRAINTENQLINFVLVGRGWGDERSQPDTVR